MAHRKSKTLLATAVSLALSSMMLAGSVNAEIISGLNTANFAAESGVTVNVYQDLTLATTNAFVDFDDSKYPGIEVYPEVFRTGGTDFAGCIMAKLDLVVNPDPLKTPNCEAPQDSSKRIKLNSTAVGPVDFVFDVADNATDTIYRWYGKLGNQTPGRLTGFKVEVGTGLGAAFVPSTAIDGLGLSVVSSPFGNFPGGLFGGSPVNPVPFFTADGADFIPTGTTEDSVEATTVPTQYSSTFGNWLPLQWVPLAWFYDDDGKPATDDLIRAWFDGTQWVDGSGKLIARADLKTWETTPVTVTDDGVLFATWDPAQELYVLASDGTTRTLDEMMGLISGDPGMERVPGYSIGVVEDLSKINVNYAVSVAAAQSICAPPCQITVRVTPIASADAASAPVWYGVDPITSDEQPQTSSDGGGGGGCAIGGEGRLDPTLPAMLAAGLGFFGWRRFKSGK